MMKTGRCAILLKEKCVAINFFKPWHHPQFHQATIIGADDEIRYVTINSSVGIALGYGMDDRGSRVRFPMGARNFPLHHRYVQNGSEAHPDSYPMGTRGSFPGGKAAGA
jgi:hypothetical protein